MTGFRHPGTDVSKMPLI